MKKDVVVYYVTDDLGILQCYYFGGILSKFFCRLHYKYLVNKYSDRVFVISSSGIKFLIENAKM